MFRIFTPSISRFQIDQAFIAKSAMRQVQSYVMA